ncbi:MAG: DUF502 domain-containing protein [Candidatus Latescibacteria bacterium]|nr:DUF502 domain-containing protein [Candidatus Latescibacterota bacterium]
MQEEERPDTSTPKRESLHARIRNRLKRLMVTGLLTLVPVAATFVVLRWVLVWMDSIAAPVIRGTIGLHIPGLGILLTLALILIVGFLGTSVFSRSVIEWAETSLMRLPIVKIVYNPVKNLLGTFAQPPDARIWRTVIVEYPRRGAWMIAFVASELPGSNGEILSVFVPNTPNPAAGRAIIVPRGEVQFVDIPIDDALEFVVSGGTAVAPSFDILKQVNLSIAKEESTPQTAGTTRILPGVDDTPG